jgi:archaellum component FlaC
MKKSTIAAALLLAFVALPAMAQSNATGTKPEKIQNATSTQVRKDIGELRKQGAKKHVESAQKNLLAAIERLENLIKRIEARVTSVTAEGTNTADATAKITEAKANIADAKSRVEKLSTLNISSGPVATTTEGRKDLNVAKGEVKAAREALINAKQNLMRAVQLLKGLRN